jgi:arginine decarboxylase
MSKCFLLCSGCGNGETELTSFDNALLRSGIANYNLVKVSSILPAGAVRKDKVTLTEGSILYTAYASKTIIGQGNIASAAVAVGIPTESDNIGVIMEFSGDCRKTDAEENARQMVEEAMKARGYEIKEILCTATEIVGCDKKYSTVLAALAMWE